MDDSREPPPLDDYESEEEQDAYVPPVKKEEETEVVVVENVDLTSDVPETTEPAVSVAESQNSNDKAEKVEDNEEDLFQSAKESPAALQSVSLDNPPFETGSKIPVSNDPPSVATVYPALPKEEDDEYDITIDVSDPHKVGEGMNAYMSYKVRTKTSIPAFKRPDSTVDRRFSDFLGLHEKMVGKHRHAGRIVPPAPEKSIVGMTLVKMSKTEEEAASIDFVEKRRAALERYLNRVAKHPALVQDQDFHDFLEQPDLPPATNTRALSGAGVMRLVKNVEGALNKMTIRMNEEDSWFEEKQQQIDSLEQQLRKLHVAFEGLVHHKKELAVNTASFAKSAATLGNAEEHTALSRALSQLSDTFEKIETVYQDESNTEYFGIAEKLGDYLRIITEIKEVFMIRVKSWQIWQTNEQVLQRKKESEAKMQAAGRSDKIAQVQSEIKDMEIRVESSKKDFDELSVAIKRDIQRFELDRVAEFRQIVLLFLQTLMKCQEQTIKNWEGFMPEARAIA
uniref:Sorting nexin-2-like n=1 Tax=Phallusia mammillata TaxID=59560 RepID=A0A6F9DTV6_9ASCI|nr:sorting nexin-2-like [Phallusia mammillata]